MPTTLLYPLPEGLAHHLHQRDARRGARAGHLAPRAVTLSALLDILNCCSHLLSPPPIGSALCRMTYTTAPDHEEGLLLCSLLLKEDFYQATFFSLAFLPSGWSENAV